MTNAELFKNVFGIYAEEFWSYPEEEMLDWIASDAPDTNDGDMISRQAAIDEIDEWIKAFRENGHKESAADARLIQDGIIQLPSAQPERKKGKWIVVKRHEHYPSGKPYEQLQCPFCKRFDNNGDGSFCGYCGADMRGEQN